MTVTDELLAEIEDGAKCASHWNLDACFQIVEEGYLPDEWYWHIGHYDEGNQYPVLLVDTDQYDAPPSDAKAVARHYANCGSRNIIALITELRRLRAENAELAQSLAESRANDQASMAWLSAYRVAGQGSDMPLPDMVTHIEGLAKDAGRLEELLRVAKDVRWRVADTTDQLQAYGYNGDRLYGLDEWSVPIRNLNIAIGMLEKAAQ